MKTRCEQISITTRNVLAVVTCARRFGSSAKRTSLSLSLCFSLDGQYKPPRTSIPTTSSRQRPAMRRDAHKASKRRFVAAALWRNGRCAAATDRFAICQQSSRKTIQPPRPMHRGAPGGRGLRRRKMKDRREGERKGMVI